VHALLRLGYEAAGQLARGLAVVAPAGDAKLWRTFRLRRGVRARFEAWGASGRDARRPLLWMHAPSVGEGLQARPVLELARRERADLQLVYTHFSPSAVAFARTLDVDFRDVLPFDTARDARAALDALRPTALVFSKLDVWPTLAAAAADRGVRLGMVSATLPERSSRRSRFAAALLRDAYAELEAVGAIDAADAERLVSLGVRRDVVRITGDTRYDQVWARAAAADRSGDLLAPLGSGRTTLVAGSTWPSDEQPLLAAWASLARARPTVRLIIAPHEPTPAHLAPIEQWAGRAGLRLARLGAAAAGDADVVLVDRVGVLGELYALSDLAYVGGGFHAAGLHSVLEPAAYGAPVVLGPRHEGSRDAGLLLAAEGAVSAGAATLPSVLGRWLDDPVARREAGERARELVRLGLGASRRSWEMVAALLV
jgi:3-deoxy-D-manno-octulosonic-acid transferase